MEVISKVFARAAGLKTYFTGVPCRSGHVALRGVAGGHCLACQAETSRKFRQENPDKIKASNKKSYVAGGEKQRLRQAALRNENLDAAREKARLQYAENVDKNRAWRNTNYKENSASYAIRHHRYYQENRAENLARAKLYRDSHLESRLANNAIRRATKILATPRWFSELDAFIWQEAFHLAKIRTKLTGIPWAVDHMIPLQGKSACGLHLGRNCQVMPACLNNLKNNKMIFTEPFEWMAHV